MQACESILQIRLYSLICGGAVFFLIFIWLMKHENDHFITSDRHYDIHRAVDKKEAMHFRVGFKYRNTHIMVSGIKAYPRRIIKQSATEHLTKEEYVHERTFHGRHHSPVLLISSETNLGGTTSNSESWNNIGALHTITGMNHDAYAIDLPGSGYTKIKGRLGSSADFYKALLDHWNWPSVILVASGKSVDHVLSLAVDDLKEFELRVQAVVLFVTDARVIQHFGALKLFRQTALFFVENHLDQSIERKRMEEIVLNLKRDIKNSKNDMEHMPEIMPFDWPEDNAIFKHSEEVNRILMDVLDIIENEF